MFCVTGHQGVDRAKERDGSQTDAEPLRALTGCAGGHAFSGARLAALAPAAFGEEVCPNAAFRSGPSANLPDCRAYEQVTPVEKEGGAFFGLVTLGAEGEPNLTIN